MSNWILLALTVVNAAFALEGMHDIAAGDVGAMKCLTVLLCAWSSGFTSHLIIYPE